MRNSGEPIMRQLALRFVPVVALLVSGFVIAGASPVAYGEEAARFVFQPGAEIFPHSHPGTTVLGVVSGSFGWTLKAGTAHVIRGAGAGSAGPVEDLTEPGADVILKAGDAIYYESDVVHTARGAGETEAVFPGSLVLTAGAPLLMPSDMKMHTPTS